MPCIPLSGRADSDTTLERLLHYRKTRDVRVLEELVASHMRFVEALAHRFTRRGVALEDLREVAMLALLKAIHRFDPEHGARFTTFAMPTILGELRRYLRDRARPIRIPRGLHDASVRVAQAEQLAWKERQSPPTPADVAMHAGLSVETVIECQELVPHALYPLSLDGERVNDDSGDVHDLRDFLGTEELGYARVDDKVTMMQALHTLEPPEQAVAYLRYYRGLSQRRAASILRLSQMQISRLQRRALAKIKRFLVQDDLAALT